ncbi:MAG: hypothetical protein Q8M15_14425 [Bacteroidota bacterium]|nr:hypothetical protein [Bacteroidota bacterium]
MNKERQIEKFIRRSIKNGGEFSNDAELQSLVEQMTNDEIALFWLRFSAGRAFSRINSNIEYWKIKKQQEQFNLEVNSYMFYPDKKDAKGKNIIDRDRYIDHVVGHLKNHIIQNIQSDLHFRNASFWEKVPYYTIVSTLVMVPIFIICSILERNNYYRGGMLFCYGIYILNFLLYGVAKLILRKRI